MGIVREINRLVKKAYMSIPNSSHLGNAMVEMAPKASRAAWGTIGAGAGLMKGMFDSGAFGHGPQGSWGDYVRTGWNVGKDNADRAAAGFLQGAAHSIPLVPTDTVDDIADEVWKDDTGGAYRAKDKDVKKSMRSIATGAGGLSAAAAQFPLYGKALGAIMKPLGMISPKVPQILGGVMTGAIGADTVYGKIQSGRYSDATDRRREEIEEFAKRFDSGKEREDYISDTKRLNELYGRADVMIPLTDEERNRRADEYLRMRDEYKKRWDYVLNGDFDWGD